MAEVLVSRLVALKAFGESLKGTAAFDQAMETQRQAVAAIIEKTPVPSEQLAQVADAIKAVPWDPTALLLALVSKATAPDMPSLQEMHRLIAQSPRAQSKFFLLMDDIADIYFMGMDYSFKK